MYLPIEYATSDPPFGLLSFPTAAPKCACRGPCRSRLSSVDDTLATVTILSVHVQGGLRPPVVRFNLSIAYRPGLGGVKPAVDGPFIDHQHHGGQTGRSHRPSVPA